jgi:hypothetical protein
VSCPMELNLRPLSVARAEKAASQKPYIIAAGVCILAGLAGWWQYYENAATKTKERVEALQGSNGKIPPLSRAQTKIKESESKIAEMLKEAQPLVELTRAREYWINVLNEVNACLPPDFIWITKFSPPTHEKIKEKEEKNAQEGKGPKGKKEAKEDAIIVEIDGLYLSTAAGNPGGQVTIDEFIKNLDKPESMLDTKEPDPAKKRRKKEAMSTVPQAESQHYLRSQENDTDWAFLYQFELKLTNPIDIK